MKKLFFMMLAVCTLASCSKGGDTPDPTAPTLTVSPTTAIAFSAAATESFSVSVITNQASWTATSDKTWCVITQGNGTFTVTALPNTSTSASAPAVITIKAGNATNVTISVTQSGQGSTLNTSQVDPISFPAVVGESQYVTVTVTTNQASWDVVSDQPTWCAVTKTGNTFTVTATANTSTSTRSATITVSAPNSANVTITVTQAGTGAATLSVNPNSAISFPAESVSPKTITITTNQATWDAQSNQTWCHVTKSGNTFAVATDNNIFSSPRTAIITVSAGSASEITLTVTQAEKIGGTEPIAKRIKSITDDNNGGSTYYFYYREDNRIDRIEGAGQYVYVSYSYPDANTIIETKGANTTNYNLDSNGYLATIPNATTGLKSYIYADGYLMKETTGTLTSSNYYDYTWGNGNMTANKITEPNPDKGDKIYTLTYEYSSLSASSGNIDINRWLMFYSPTDIRIFNLIGKRSTNLISRDVFYRKSYKYDVDADGYVTKIMDVISEPLYTLVYE